MAMIKKDIKKEKPNKDQVILFKSKKSKLPEVGIWQEFDNNIKEIYIPAYDDVEMINNIEWWSEIPSNDTIHNVTPRLFYVVTESHKEEGDWEQLSIGMKTYEEALKFKNSDYHKTKYPYAFIVCTLNESKYEK